MKTLALALPAMLVSLFTSLPAQQELHDLMKIGEGSALIGRGESSVANMGDLDGDGMDDLVAGARTSPSNPNLDGTVFVISSRTNRQLAKIHGRHNYGQFGYCIENLGDVDKDGVPDFGVGSPTAPFISNTSGPGLAFVYSGKTRKLIRTITPGPTFSIWFGAAIAGMGDLDADGHADYAVSAPDVNNPGRVYVYSGKAGTLLYTIVSAEYARGFGRGLAELPDIDGDKVMDLAILSRPVRISSTVTSSPIWWYSGKTGKLIRRALTTPRHLGDSSLLLRTCEDLDGDKKRDVLVGWPNAKISNFYEGEVQAYSSGTAKLLHSYRLTTSSRNIGFGRSFDCVPDRDNDGSPEILIGDTGFYSGMTSKGAIHVFSAKSEKLIETITTRIQQRSNVSLGHSLTALGDLNRDGNWDFCTDIAYSSPSTRWLQVFSANSLDLSTDTSSVSIFRGGKAAISIHAGTKHANDLVMMLGSASGSYPGILVSGKRLHLNADSYLTFTLGAPHAVFFNNLSVLDANGQGGVGFVLPTGLSPALAGTVLHHSCLFVGKGGLDFANIAVPLEIQLF